MFAKLLDEFPACCPKFSQEAIQSEIPLFYFYFRFFLSFHFSFQMVFICFPCFRCQRIAERVFVEDQIHQPFRCHLGFVDVINPFQVVMATLAVARREFCKPSFLCDPLVNCQMIIWANYGCQLRLSDVFRASDDVTSAFAGFWLPIFKDAVMFAVMRVLVVVLVVVLDIAWNVNSSTGELLPSFFNRAERR